MLLKARPEAMEGLTQIGKRCAGGSPDDTQNGCFYEIFFYLADI
jgi:hypothetical protein